MPLGLEFYTVLALAAAGLLGITALIGQIRDPHGADPRGRRAALHFTLPLLFALAVLLPPYEWVLPVGYPVVIYFWQIGLLAMILLLLRGSGRSRGPGAGRPLALYVGAVLYLLALLVSLIYDDKAAILTLVSFGLLLHLFAGIRTLLPAPTPPPGG